MWVLICEGRFLMSVTFDQDQTVLFGDRQILCCDILEGVILQKSILALKVFDHWSKSLNECLVFA